MVVNFDDRQILALKTVVSAIAQRGWCPATGGNFSVKLADNLYGITASGIDKTAPQKDDFLVIDSKGKVILGDKKPSAETLLHTALYKLDSQIGAVLHVHTVANTVLSLHNNEAISFQGYEMQKALTGITTHETTVKIPILENDQNMEKLATILNQRWQTEVFYYGSLTKNP